MTWRDESVGSFFVDDGSLFRSMPVGDDMNYLLGDCDISAMKLFMKIHDKETKIVGGYRMKLLPEEKKRKQPHWWVEKRGMVWDINVYMSKTQYEETARTNIEPKNSDCNWSYQIWKRKDFHFHYGIEVVQTFDMTHKDFIIHYLKMDVDEKKRLSKELL